MSTLKYQLENAKHSKRHLKGQNKKLEEELSQLKIKYEKRTKPKTDNDVDSARSALLESVLSSVRTKLLFVKCK